MLSIFLTIGIFIFRITVELLYPIKKSVQPLKADDARQWLSYWVIYFFIYVIEVATFFMTSIPFYYYIKSVVCLWLVHPYFMGASWLQDNFIDPIFKQFEPFLRPVMSKIMAIGAFKDEVKKE